MPTARMMAMTAGSPACSSRPATLWSGEWPVLTPAELLHDLFGSPALLRLAAPLAKNGYGAYLESLPSRSGPAA